MTLVDTHCHLADAGFGADLPEVAARARAAGVAAAVCILSADEPEELARVVEVRAAWAAVRFAAGVHPHRAAAYAGAAGRAAERTAAAVDAVDAVAVGEVGLDYHYDFAPRNVQRDVFAAQVALAGTRRLPIVVHAREAMDDTMAVLAAAPEVRGVMHCFTGTVDEARRALDRGCFISLAGIVTFQNSAVLRDVAAFVPDDRLLLETDAPFLAPVPHRGKRNEPAWVAETCAVVARLRGVEPDALAAQIARNARELFGVDSVAAPPRVDTPAKPMV